ncbi:hypothetical protein [Novosphingobium sp.]|uniref:hypothetical protein n=1 Tax=Novosphingobium sp. TaxID=1874826 RepID=UPI002FDCBD75
MIVSIGPATLHLGDAYQVRPTRCLWRRWDAAVRLLSKPESMMRDGVPAAMTEQLRREGLL